MQAILVRIGVDHAYGAWNAPADPASGRFVYVPIPESQKTKFLPRCRRSFLDVWPAVEQLGVSTGHTSGAAFGFPSTLRQRAMHLDPDFEFLTYGDDGARRGSGIRSLTSGDLLVFYAGLRSIRPQDTQLLYSLVGLLVIEKIAAATDVPAAQRDCNAHTRKVNRCPTDIVVYGRKKVSGRLARHVPIGEYRNGAYRVRRDILKAWGGLGVKDGFIQRSAVPPRLLDAERFYRWFLQQEVPLIPVNN